MSDKNVNQKIEPIADQQIEENPPVDQGDRGLDDGIEEAGLFIEIVKGDQIGMASMLEAAKEQVKESARRVSQKFKGKVEDLKGKLGQ